MDMKKKEREKRKHKNAQVSKLSLPILMKRRAFEQRMENLRKEERRKRATMIRNSMLRKVF